MTVPVLMPWIGSTSAIKDTTCSKLISPIDQSVVSEMIESDAKVVDQAVKHAHAAFLKHEGATIAKRVEWLTASADAIDKIEAEIVRSLIRYIGKPKRAATFEAKRVGAFIRACAAQVPHLNGEVLPLDATAAGAGRFGFTTRVPYGVVAAVTPFNGPANLLIQKVAPALAVGNAVVVKPSPPGTEVALLIAEAMKKAGLARRSVQRGTGRPRDREASRRTSAGGGADRHRFDRAGNDLARAAGAKKVRRRARLQRRQHRVRRRRPAGCGDAHRRRGVRGQRPAVHLGAARDRRARRATRSSCRCSSKRRRSSRSATRTTPRSTSARW